MNILLEIISSLDKEEIRFYKLFAGRTNSSYARKDILLFDFIKQNREEYNEQIISDELYKDNKNSFFQFFNFWITHRIVIAVASFTIFMNVVILMLVKKFFTVSFSRNGQKKGLKGMFIFARLQQ